MSPAPSRFALSASLFLRLLAVVHLVAFASAWTQLAGLIGPHGLLPAQPFFDAVLRQLGPAEARDQLPSLCWFIGAGPTGLGAGALDGRMGEVMAGVRVRCLQVGRAARLAWGASGLECHMRGGTPGKMGEKCNFVT